MFSQRMHEFLLDLRVVFVLAKREIDALLLKRASGDFVALEKSVEVVSGPGSESGCGILGDGVVHFIDSWT